MQFVSSLNTPSSSHARLFPKTFLGSIVGALTLIVSTMMPAMADPIQGIPCIEAQPAYTKGTVSCNANDVALSSPFVTVIKPCNFPGDFATLEVEFDLTVKNQRNDISIWFSVDGDPNGDGPATGVDAESCTVAGLPNNLMLNTDGTPTIPTNYDTDFDGDMCGDAAPTGEEKGQNEVDVLEPQILDVNLGSFNLLCNDSDNDGKLDVPVIISWQNSATDNCPTFESAVPETSSKCEFNNAVSLDIPIPGVITVDKQTLPADATEFEFTLTGPDSGFDGGFTSPHVFSLADASTPFNSSTAFTGGLPAEVSGTLYQITETPNASYTSVGTCESSVDGANTDPANILLRSGETVNCTFTNELLVPAYSIDKTVTDVGGDGPLGVVAAAGDQIDYQIVVTNTGNQVLTGVSVADPLLGALTGPVESGTADGNLEVAETWTYTGSYTALQADIDDNGGGDGDIDNTATVSSNELPDDSDSASVTIAQVPAYSIVKSVTDVGGDGPLGSVDAAGDQIDYQIVVTNTGNQTITGVTVADPLLGVLTGPVESGTVDGNLEVAETWTYTGSYIALQADIDDNGGGDGDIDNTATVSSNELDDLSDSAAVPIAGAAAYTIDKTVTDVGGDGPLGVVAAAGDQIDYQIVVTNTGSLTITGVTVADPLLGALTGPVESGTADGNLEVAETWTYTGSYTALQADIDDNGGGDGDIDNTATVSSNELPDDSDSASVTIAQVPAYSIVKSVTDVGGDGPLGSVDAAGDQIDYQIVVTNTGNQTITGVTVADPLLGVLTGPVESGTADGNLEVAETWTYTGSYIALQADIDDNGGGDGDIDNTATVSSNELDDESDSAAVPLDASPAMTLDKSSGTSEVTEAGQIVGYSYVVTNTGNATLTNVTLVDNNTDAVPVCAPAQPATLAPAEAMNCTANKTVSENEFAADNSVDNIATADSDETVSVDDSLSIPINRPRPPQQETTPVPVNSPLALLLLTLMMLATGWYFRPAGMRKF